MQTAERDNLVFVRLFPDENIYKKLKEACIKHNLKTGVIISGIGQLKNFELGYFKERGDYTPKKFNEPYELLNLAGNICRGGKDYNFHIHAVLGDKDKSVRGGHLIDGTVEITNEIVILKSDIKMVRKLEEKTGLKKMLLE